MIMTALGTLIRTSMDGISSMGRNTQGVRLIHTREDDTVATVTRVARSEENENLDEAQEDGENDSQQ
jgi:DNA gyrase subunit A